MLLTGGLYLIFSIHDTAFLEQLLDLPQLGLRLISFQSLPDLHASVILCEKVNEVFDLEEYLQHEHEVLDGRYQREQPLLTEEYADYIRRSFGSTQSLAFPDAYEVMFGSEKFTGNLQLTLKVAFRAAFTMKTMPLTNSLFPGVSFYC